MFGSKSLLTGESLSSKHLTFISVMEKCIDSFQESKNIPIIEDCSGVGEVHEAVQHPKVRHLRQYLTYILILS